MDTSKNQEIDLLRFTTAGSVDDGKSTLIGRLLYDSKQIYDDVLTSMNITSERAGKSEIDLALLTDGLRAEREQGITIDVAYRYFSTPKRRFIIADTPGHEQYTRNMITGASTANLAIILLDARKGILEQSRRHAIIASLLRIPHIIVAINKMDLVDWSEEIFKTIKAEFADFCSTLNLSDVNFCPISALIGDNVVFNGENMPWYNENTVMDHLETIEIEKDLNLKNFRLPIQCVIRPNLDFRGFAGQISSGVIKKGDQIITYPSQKTSIVKGIHTYEGEIEYAFAPMSITLTLEDEIDISRGDIISNISDPVKNSSQLTALICWMGEEDSELNEPYFIKTRYSFNSRSYNQY